MALNAGLLIPPFISTFRKFNVVPEIAATEMVQGIDSYLRSSMNIALGNFLFWVPPIGQVITLFRTPNVVPEIFATQLAAAIESGLSSIYTLYQISLVVPYGLMLGDLIRICRTPNIVPEVFAIEMAIAIDKECRSIIVTATDPKLLGTPIVGPLF